MLTGPALENVVASIALACRSGLDDRALRAAVLPRLRKVVPVDALWWATVDPTTLLFTRAHREELPEDSGPYFVANEFLHQDVNKWTELAHEPAGVRTLMDVTHDDPNRSQRYRDIFSPLHLEDELRAALVVGGVCWGFLCLHREAADARFSPAEVGFIQRVAPHLADAIRMGLLRQACELGAPAYGPGLVLIATDGAIMGTNEAAGRWLEALGGHPDGSDLPVEIIALATRLRHLDATHPSLPRLRVRLLQGGWAVLHASWMANATGVVAVIIEAASAAEISPILMIAFGLSDRERAIAGLVCHGLPSRTIGDRLHITVDTVQDHLKSIFDKTGVRSRGALVATILQHDYLPHLNAGDPIQPTGGFRASKPPT